MLPLPESAAPLRPPGQRSGLHHHEIRRSGIGRRPEKGHGDPFPCRALEQQGSGKAGRRYREQNQQAASKPVIALAAQGQAERALIGAEPSARDSLR